jgi:hypothetical protein
MDSEKVSHTLALLAEDIVSAPASEAYCECVFSVCGDFERKTKPDMCQLGRAGLHENEFQVSVEN